MGWHFLYYRKMEEKNLEFHSSPQDHLLIILLIYRIFYKRWSNMSMWLFTELYSLLGFTLCWTFCGFWQMYSGQITHHSESYRIVLYCFKKQNKKPVLYLFVPPSLFSGNLGSHLSFCWFSSFASLSCQIIGIIQHVVFSD